MVRQKQGYMKKSIVVIGLTALMALSISTISFAGEWKQDSNGWWYQNDDGTYPHTGWAWLNGKCYYFTPEGYCLTGTKTPDGYEVDGNGAWVVNGTVQTQQHTPVRGWNYVDGAWKYYFAIDDIHYVVDSDGIITDEIDEFDWFSGNYESDNSNWYSDDWNNWEDSEAYDDYDNEFDWSSSYEEVDDSSYAYDVFELVNREREQNNKDALEWDDELAACAQERAYEITEKYSHTRPDGSSCFSVLEEEGISHIKCGENIAYGQRTPERVMTSWMNSSGHKKNIMNASFGHIGVGCAEANGNYYWVQLFTD